MLSHQVHKTVDGFDFGDVEFDRGFSDVEVDLSRRSADIPKIGVRHFARTIHNTTHDGDLHSLKMLRALFDSSSDGLKIEQRPATGWASDVIRFERTASH